MFAAIDTVIGLLVFFAIAAVSSWLKKRQRGDHETGPAPPPPRRPGSKPAGWEEELRRLLEGDEPTSPPPMPPRPPPVPTVPAPKRVFTPPKAVTPAEEMERGLAVELPTLTQSAQSYQRASQLEQQVEQFMQRRAALSTSAAAFERASQLDVKVSEHLRQVVEQTPTPARVPGRRLWVRSPDAAQAVALLRHPPSLRSALLASVILGPPKALEG
jgi:hypothetical protein